MYCARRDSSQKYALAQRGQALVPGLVLTGIILLAWGSSYYIGHLVHDKVSLLRATDAAVLSAATIQARTLNFHAYLNRAQLANQLAMMHLVTLASHERFRATQAIQSLGMNPPAFLIGMFFGPAYSASYLASQAGGVSDSYALDTLKKAFHQHDLVIKEMLEQTRQVLLHEMNLSRKLTLEKVLIRNVGDSGSMMIGNSLSELGLSYAIKLDELKDKVRYLSVETPVWKDAFKQVLEPYAFLKPRNDTRLNMWAVNVRCPHKRHELRRRGHSAVAPNGSYVSEDTISFHAIRSNRAIGCYQREYPMGWAQVSASMRRAALSHGNTMNGHDGARASDIQRFSNESFWRWVKNQGNSSWNIFNGTENKLAQSWSHPQKISWQSNAKAGFVQIAPSEKEFRFDIETSQKSSFLSQHVEQSRFAGRFTIPGLDPTDSLTASASSVTYFSRPSPRKDGHSEGPSLFHPYWHARLVSR